MRTHICVAAQQPLFTMPIKWAEQLTPDMLDRLKAVYEEMVRANGDTGRWRQFNVHNLVLCICILSLYFLTDACGGGARGVGGGARARRPREPA